VLGPLRTLISVAFLVVFLWAAFTVKLGRFTFADHVDRIGQTDEAQELLDGARSRVRPTLEEVKQRVLGEYVEAPTYVAAPPPDARARSPQPAAAGPQRATTDLPPGAPERATTAIRAARAPSRASTAEAAKLPGRRAPAPRAP